MSGISLECVCQKCGREFAFAHPDFNRRIATLRCDCGGKLSRGKVIGGRPSPVEVYRAALALVEAEEDGETGQLQKALAELEWERVRELMRTGVQLRRRTA